MTKDQSKETLAWQAEAKADEMPLMICDDLYAWGLETQDLLHQLSAALREREGAQQAGQVPGWKLEFADERDFCRAASVLLGAAYVNGKDAVESMPRIGSRAFGSVLAAAPEAPAEQAKCQRCVGDASVCAEQDALSVNDPPFPLEHEPENEPQVSLASVAAQPEQGEREAVNGSDHDPLIEQSLAVLIDLICPDLDSGDIVRDAQQAMRELNKRAASAQAKKPMDDYELRGLLASKLACWHRLTEQEAENLIQFVRGITGEGA